LDYKFELLRTIHTGIVAVAEWYNFRIPTSGASTAELAAVGKEASAPDQAADEQDAVEDAAAEEVSHREARTGASWTATLPREKLVGVAAGATA